MPYIRTCTIGLLVAAILLGPASGSASADRGRCGLPGRPACSILRPPELDALSTPESGLGPECIVTVGGFDSANGDVTFDDLLAPWLQQDPLYQQYRFGSYRADRFPYDTTGPIDVSADDLRDLVRSIKGQCRGVHLLTHSMGGVVADRAFSMGLSAHDRVATYVALSGPHNGGTLAKDLRPPIEANAVVALEISALAKIFGQPDPTTQAAHDLAELEQPRVLVRGIPHIRLRLATDPMVLRRDTADRRVDVREYLPEAWCQWEGHGGILENDEVMSVIRATISSHRPAPDRRSAQELGLADRVSQAVDPILAGLYADVANLLRSDAAPYILAAAVVAARSAITSAPEAAALCRHRGDDD